MQHLPFRVLLRDLVVPNGWMVPAWWASPFCALRRLLSTSGERASLLTPTIFWRYRDLRCLARYEHLLPLNRWLPHQTFLLRQLAGAGCLAVSCVLFNEPASLRLCRLCFTRIFSAPAGPITTTGIRHALFSAACVPFATEACTLPLPAYRVCCPYYHACFSPAELPSTHPLSVCLWALGVWYERGWRKRPSPAPLRCAHGADRMCLGLVWRLAQCRVERTVLNSLVVRRLVVDVYKHCGSGATPTAPAVGVLAGTDFVPPLPDDSFFWTAFLPSGHQRLSRKTGQYLAAIDLRFTRGLVADLRTLTSVSVLLFSFVNERLAD